MKAVITAHDPLCIARDHGIIHTLMSDLLQVGTQCSLSSCNVNDFLPITCKCTQVFCRDHILPDAHACPAVTTSTGAGTQAGRDEKEGLRRCDIEGCNKPTLFAFTTSVGRETCEKCRKAFCVECVVHFRRPSSHSDPTAPYKRSVTGTVIPTLAHLFLGPRRLTLLLRPALLLRRTLGLILQPRPHGCLSQGCPPPPRRRNHQLTR